eukprot:988282-Pyramimonas_sp.AAC.2
MSHELYTSSHISPVARGSHSYSMLSLRRVRREFLRVLDIPLHFAGPPVPLTARGAVVVVPVSRKRKRRRKPVHRRTILDTAGVVRIGSLAVPIPGQPVEVVPRGPVRPGPGPLHRRVRAPDPSHLCDQPTNRTINNSITKSDKQWSK